MKYTFIIIVVLLLGTPIVELRAETTVITARIDRFCEGNFLPDAEVAEVPEWLVKWAEYRRFVVRYDSNSANVVITPPAPALGRSTGDLVEEMTNFFQAFGSTCPLGATRLPVATTGVKGLDIAPNGTFRSLE